MVYYTHVPRDNIYCAPFPPNSWLSQKYASVTAFSIFPGFAIKTELMQALGITAARPTSRPNYRSTFVAIPACFICQAVWALSRTIWCLFGGGQRNSVCVMTILTPVSLTATTELITLNLVTAGVEIFFYPDAHHGQRKRWEGIIGRSVSTSHIYS